MAGVIEDPQNTIVPHQAGVARIAGAGEAEDGAEFFRGEEAETGVGLGAVAVGIEAAAGDPAAIGEDDEIRAAEEVGGLLPLPVGVGGRGGADVGVGAGLGAVAHEGDGAAVGEESEGGFVAAGDVEFGDGLPLEAVAAGDEALAAGVILQFGGRGAVFGDAVGAAVVPGDAPEPVAFGDDGGGDGPFVAVGGEEDSALAAFVDAGGVVGTAADDHEAIVGGEGKMGVAEVDAGFGEEGFGFPGGAVFRRDDAEFAVVGFAGGGGVSAAFTEDGEPAVVEADEIAEGGVLGLAPDAAVFEDGPVLRVEGGGE